jgi:hypothetical protein
MSINDHLNHHIISQDYDLLYKSLLFYIVVFMNDSDQVVDAEIVQSSSPQAPTQTEILFNMEGLIKNHMAAIDKLQEELRKNKEMLDDIFNNDPTFKDHSDKAKEAAKIKQNTKAQILKQPQARELDEKVRSIKSQMKENQDSLSDYLQEYARMAGVNEIEGDDGEVREIVYSAKLVRKSAFRP